MSACRLGKVIPKTSILFLCDMQEKFRPNISYFPQIISVAARMLKAAKALEIPTVVTEQYPKGLGPTVPELGAEGLQKYPKTCFSMIIPEIEKEMAAVPNLKSVLLCGIETQACIMSTALDLMERGLDVHIVVDACSSRSQVDRIVALSRLRQSGAFLTTSEGLILQLVRDAAHPNFRENIVPNSQNDNVFLARFCARTAVLAQNRATKTLSFQELGTMFSSRSRS